MFNCKVGLVVSSASMADSLGSPSIALELKRNNENVRNIGGPHLDHVTMGNLWLVGSARMKRTPVESLALF